MTRANFRFDWIFIKRFLRLCRRMFPSFGSGAVLMTFFLLALSLLEQVVIYNIGLVPSKYYKVLGDKDYEGFKSHTIQAILLILGEAAIKSIIAYVGSMLYITWRQELCKSLHGIYFTKILYYHVNVVDKTIDNPDQRITQDVDRLTSTFSKVFAPLIISPFTIGYYMYQASNATGYLGPVSVIVFFIIFTLINKYIMSPVVRYVYQQEQREGDFRFKHMQLRVHAESAAFYRAGVVEEKKTNQKLEQLISKQRKLIHWQLPLNFSVSAADYLGSILSYIAIAFPLFSGSFNNLPLADLSALISQYSFVNMYLINCFTSLLDLANSFTDIAGTAHRIGQLFEVLDQLKSEVDDGRSGAPTYDTSMELALRNLNDLPRLSTEPAFIMESVTYGPPKSSDILCRDLSLQLNNGTNVLVTGCSGCGKTSLLRILSGLWKIKSGFLHVKVRQGPEGLMYLPQKPYLTNGSLRDQIVYPFTEAEVVPDDDRMYHYLKVVGLDQLSERIGGLDMDLDWKWYDELSPGEMQRLSFVRLFFHQPSFAILDEATSQVSQEMEMILYQTCTSLKITLLSVGHRDSIQQFHHNVLHMDGNGGWSFHPITYDSGGVGDGAVRHISNNDDERNVADSVAERRRGSLLNDRVLDTGSINMG